MVFFIIYFPKDPLVEEILEKDFWGPRGRKRGAQYDEAISSSRVYAER